MLNRLVRFMRLQAWERHVLLQSLVLLPMMSLRIRWLGLVRAFSHSRGLLDARPDHDGDVSVRALRVACLVHAAARHGPFRATCLPISLTLHRLLQERGIGANLRLGVRKAGGRLEAHAWIERDGEPLMEPPKIGERYAAFDEPIVPGMGASR